MKKMISGMSFALLIGTLLGVLLSGNGKVVTGQDDPRNGGVL